jgi:hypothetical protein
MVTHRAGGWVDREDGEGWVLDDTQPEPAPEAVEHQPLKPTMEAAGGWRLVPEPPPTEPEPEPAVEVEAEPEPPSEPEPEAEAEEQPRPSNAEVRAWAKAEGINVPARGPVSDDLVAQYLNREA